MGTKNLDENKDKKINDTNLDENKNDEVKKEDSIDKESDKNNAEVIKQNDIEKNNDKILDTKTTENKDNDESVNIEQSRKEKKGDDKKEEQEISNDKDEKSDSCCSKNDDEEEKKCPVSKGLRLLIIILFVMIVLGIIYKTTGCNLAKIDNGNNNSQEETTAVANKDENQSEVQEKVKTDLEMVQEIAATYEPAIVSVVMNDGSQKLDVIGTAVVFDEDEENIYIVSNQHVIYDRIRGKAYERSEDLFIQFDDENVCEMSILGSDTRSDLAVLKVSKEKISKEFLSKLVPVNFADSDKVKVGEGAIAIGNPLGFVDTTTFGIVSAINRKMDLDVDFIQIDAAINSGNSGGATFNLKGEVIGINTIKIQDTGVEGLGFAVSANDVKKVITEIRENGKVDRPYLGVIGLTISAQKAEQFDLPKGAWIETVEKESGAYMAGILPGDVITSADGNKIESIEDLIKVIQSKKVGDSIELTVFRAGQDELKLTAKLTSRND